MKGYIGLFYYKILFYIISIIALLVVFHIRESKFMNANVVRQVERKDIVLLLRWE